MPEPVRYDEWGTNMAALNDEQTMLRDMAREWSDNESPVSAFRKLRGAATGQGYDPTAWAAQGEMGWAGIVVPEEYGGSGFGWLSLGLVLEQLGRNLSASPLAATASAAAAIAMGASEEAKSKWLPKIASGEVVATIAVDEGPVHAGDGGASAVGDGRLNGTKEFVAEGDSAGLFVVAAKDGLYLVDGAAGGVTRAARKMADNRSHAQVTFKDAPAERLGGPELTAQIVDRATAATCAEMLGLALAAVRPDQRLFEGPRPVRPAAFDLPGAAAPNGEDVHRTGADAVGGRGGVRGDRRGPR